MLICSGHLEEKGEAKYGHYRVILIPFDEIYSGSLPVPRAIYLLCKQVVKSPWWFCFENTLIECLCYENGDDCNCCVISTGELFCYFFLRQLFCYLKRA